MNVLLTLHAESALVCSLIGFFLSVLVKNRSVLLLLPVLFLILLLTDLTSSCFSWQGTSLWLLHVGSSTLLGLAFSRGWSQSSSRQKTLLIALLIFWFPVDLVIQIKSSSAVYYFNHIAGFWPGPIYDRSVNFGWNHFVFRLETLVLAGILFSTSRFPVSVSFVTHLAIIALHLFLGPIFQWRQTPENIRSRLSESVQLNDLTLHLPPHLDEGKRVAFINQAKFHWTDLKKMMKISDPLPTHIFIYANYWQKDSLVGAKFTQYVPVWLSRNEIHLSQESYSETLRHEMVHVLAKPYGFPILNASLSGAIIEGLAVALSPNTSTEFTIDELVNAADMPNAQILARTFSISGFYAARGSVSYAVAGSFIRFLIHKYGIEAVMKSYALADLEVQLGATWEELTEAWQKYLKERPRNLGMEKQAQRLFSRLSPMEMNCPHVLSVEAFNYDLGLYLRQVNQPEQALKAFRKSSSESAWWQWTQLAPAHMNPEEISQKIWFPQSLDSLRTFFYLLQLATVNEEKEKQQHLLRELKRSERGKSLAARVDSLIETEQWMRGLEFEFRTIGFSELTNQELNSPGFVREWLSRMERNPPYPRDLAKVQHHIKSNLWNADDLLRLIALSLSVGQEDETKLYLSDLKTRTLTPRQQERYQGFLSWLHFLQSNSS